MGKRRYELDTRVLTIFFFVAMPFVAFGSFVVVNMARGQLQDQLGADLGQRAIESRLLLERYLSDQVTHLHLLAIDPQVRDALAKPRPAEDPHKLESGWTSNDPKLTAAIVQSPLGQRLRDLAQVASGYVLTQVVDARGTLLASTARGGRVLNAETAWFKFLASREYLEAKAFVGDIQRPAGGGPAVLEIAYPVLAADGRFQGALRVVIDAAEVYEILAPTRVSRSNVSYVFPDAPAAFLVRAEDGVILAGEDAAAVLSQPYAGFASLQAAQRERRGYWIVPEVQPVPGGPGRPVPARLVAYTPFSSFPNAESSASWLVVVDRNLAQATAPIQNVTRYLWLHFIGAFSAVILLALYFSFKLEQPVIEEELHLHEQHVPSSMRSGVES